MVTASATKNRSMDGHLFMEIILFYASLYPNIAITFVWDRDQLAAGSILIKPNIGPGRIWKICKSLRSIKFRQKMHLRGIYLLPSLPNSIGVW